MKRTVDKSQYQQIQNLIQQNPNLSGFDLYYLGFFSHFVDKLNLNEIFTHIGNIINLHSDGLINNEEKIEFLIRMLSKKMDPKLFKALNPQADDAEGQENKFLNTYFSQILKVLPRFANVSKFEVFYIGLFHAICPSYKIAELFTHINNINVLVTEDLIDEETQADFLLKIINKKILSNTSQETVLNIPTEGLSPLSKKDSAPPPQDIIYPKISASIEPKWGFTDNNKDNKPQQNPQNQQNSRNEKSIKPIVEERVPVLTIFKGKQEPDIEQDRRDVPQKKISMKDTERSESGSNNEAQEEDMRSEASNKSSERNGRKDQGLKKAVIEKQFSFMAGKMSADLRALTRKDVVNSEELGSPQTMDDDDDIEEVEEKPLRRINEESDIEEYSESQNRYVGESTKNKDKEIEIEKPREKEHNNQQEEEENYQDNRSSPSIEKEQSTKSFFREDSGVMEIEEKAKSKSKGGSVREPSIMEEEEEEKHNILGRFHSEPEGEDNEEEINKKIVLAATIEEEDPISQRINSQKSQKQVQQVQQVIIPESDDGTNSEMTPLKDKVHNEKGLESAGQESLIMFSGEKGREIEMEIEENKRQLSLSQKQRLEAVEEKPVEEQESMTSMLNQSDQSDVQKLMAQLYPKKDSFKAQVPGTMDDILNNIFGGSDVDPLSRSNSILPSLEAGKNSPFLKSNSLMNQVEKNQDNHIFAVPKNYPKKDQNTSERIEEMGMEEEETELLSQNASKKRPVQQQQAPASLDSNFEIDELVQVATQEDPNSQFSFKISQSQASQPVGSYLLNWKNKAQNQTIEDEERNQYYREHILEQVTNHIQAGLLDSQVIKQEDLEAKRILEANTQADPTLDDNQGYSSGKVSPLGGFRSPFSGTNPHNQHEDDPNVRLCQTVKQTLSQINKEDEEAMEIIAAEVAQKNQVAEDKDNNPLGRKGTGSSSHSRRDTFNELYGRRDTFGEGAVNPTMLSKMSSMGMKLSTLEEEKLSRELLAELEKDRGHSEQGSKRKQQLERIEEEEDSNKLSQKEEKQEQLNKGEIRSKEKQIVREGSPLLSPVSNPDTGIEEESFKKAPKIDEADDEDRAAVRKKVETKKTGATIREKLPEIVINKPQENIEIEKEDDMMQEEIKDSTTCSLCRKSFMLKATALLECCNHTFHGDCLREYIEKSVDEKRALIKCPKNNCPVNLRLVDLMDFVSTEKQEKYIIFSLKAYVQSHEEVSCCPTPSCSYAFSKETYPNKFACPVCEKNYCMSCHVDWHQGISCHEYQKSHKREEGEERKSENNGKYKQCGSCKYWVVKKPGTNLMRCRCGSSFCYSCNQKGLKGECQCSNRENEGKPPIVQPELFHKVMQSPPEFRKFAENKASNNSNLTTPAQKKEGRPGHVYKPLSQESDGRGERPQSRERTRENSNSRGSEKINGRGHR